MEKRNIEETKQKYEELLKRIDEAQRTQNKNNKSGATEEETKAYFLACIDERQAKQELTKARKEFAEAIMFNFEETDNNPYQEKLEAKKYLKLYEENKIGLIELHKSLYQVFGTYKKAVSWLYEKWN